MSEKKFMKMMENQGTTMIDMSQSRYRVFTFDYVFKKIIDYSDNNAEYRLRKVVNWKIPSTENIIKSLLKNCQDKIAWY